MSYVALMRRPSVSTIIVWLALSFSTFAQTTINVPADQPTIQAGIDAAQNGDTVLVAPGTYYENINFRGKLITLKSSDGPSATVIDGSANGSVVTFNSGESSDAVLSGFTIQNGWSTWGAGIEISDSSPIILGNTIKGNQGETGLGIDIEGGSPEIRNNVITENSEISGWNRGGGGIRVSTYYISNSPLIVGNTITYNKLAIGNGGGIYVEGYTSPIIQDNVIKDNTANDGGGIAVQASLPVTIVQNIIANNSSGASGIGGGLVLHTGSPDLRHQVRNNTIVANRDSSNFSGIYLEGPPDFVEITNNVVVAAEGQYAIYCVFGGAPRWGQIANNDMYSATGMAWGGECDPASYPYNVSSDPQFVNAATGDYHLSSTSPAIDVGWNAPDLPSTDADGNARIIDGNGDGNAVVDLGAFEYMPLVTFSPATLDFGNQEVGTASPPQAVSVTALVTLQNISVSTTGDFTQTNNCPTPMPSGTSCTVWVTFTPTQTGPRSGALVVTSSEYKAESSMMLSGNRLGAVLTVNPSSLTFSNVVVGTTPSQVVTLTSSGDAPVTISSIDTPSWPPLFSQSNNCPTSLEPGTSCMITVAFAPTATGTYGAELGIVDNAVGSPHVVSLSGTAIAPVLNVSPSSLTFSNVLIGTTASQAVTLRSGDAAVTISSIPQLSWPFSQSNNCPTLLPAGASCTITVTFAPTASGITYGTEVSIVDNAAGSPQTVPISGTAIAPVLNVSPSSLTFSNVVVGTTASQVVTLSSGNAAVTISSISQLWPPFSQSNNCPTSLPAGASCTITVTFAPTASGITYSTQLRIFDNAAGSPQTVSLSGTTVTPVLILNPQSLIFNNVAVGTTVSQVATLTNSSSAAVSISSISSPSSPFSQSNNCPTSLSPGASCAITVTFAPTANGTYSSQLIVVDNAADSQQMLSLSGTAITPVLTVNPSSIIFNNVVSGARASQVITLTSSGDSPVTMRSISPLSSPFSQLSNCPASLPVGASCSITVTFAPTASGTYTATLSVADNAANSPQMASLSGTAVTPVLAVNPSSLTFSNVLAGTTASQVVTLTSSGDAAVNISSISSPSAPYSRSTNCPTSLPVGTSCAITVTFSPLAGGTYTSAISINDNGLGGPHSVSLSGNAIFVQLSVSPSSLAFGSVTVGTSATKAITVANSGDLPVSINGISAAGNGFTQSNNCPASLAVGTSCEIDVAFSPTDVTNHTGAVAIADNTMPNGHTVTATGTGLAVGAPNPIDVPADQPTVQAGIDAAQNGDTVLVAPGTYYENINFHGKAITVKSSSGPSATIIDGSANGPVVTFNSGETTSAVLSGFTVQNGYSSISGGGIKIIAASPTISGNVVVNNHAIYGNGIEINNGSPVIKNNTITRNTQTAGTGGYGGGISVIGTSGNVAAPLITDNIISNNDVRNGGDGGGVGAQMYASPTIQNNVIQGNRAYNNGGGIALFTYLAPVVMQNIVANNSSGGGGYGAGIYVYVHTAQASKVVNNTIVGNSAGDKTSGIYVIGTPAAATITNNVVIAATGENGINCDASQNAGSAKFSYNDVYSATGQAWVGVCDTTSYPGNISVDPQFVNAAAGDYHLQASSPTVDAGDNAAPNLPTTDLDGNPRIRDGNADGTAVVDMGAYEFPGFPVLTVTPGSVNFGDVRVGSNSTRTLTLTSSSEQPVNISSIAELSPPYSQTNDCPGSLAVGANCTVTITFAPASRGVASASLAISSNAAKGPSTVSITGTGVAPVVGLSPASVAFGVQRYGTSGAPQTVTLSNVGDAVLNIGGISLAGSGFTQTNNCAATLQAGASCQISITFTPPTRRTFSGMLTITDDAEGSPQEVTLNGTGVAPIATFSSTAVAFPEQVLGTTSAAQSVTLTNTGDATLNISGLTVSGDFAQGSNCGASLAAGASCTINLTFTPSATGARSGSLNISSDTYGTAPVVSLSGTGVMAAPTLSTTSLEFEDVNVGDQSATKTIKLTANSPGPLSISSITVSGPFVQANNCPATLTPGSTCNIRVVFQPTAIGAVTGVLTISDDGMGSPQSVTLSGKGED